MRDFDISRFEGVSKDRRFKIGGEEFEFRAKVSAEKIASYIDATHQEGNLAEVVKTADEFILSALKDPGEQDRWHYVRENADPPLNIIDIQAVVSHILDATTGRPFERPSDSSSTSSPSGTSSTDNSPSLAAV